MENGGNIPVQVDKKIDQQIKKQQEEDKAYQERVKHGGRS